jgi:hypothetical protein
MTRCEQSRDALIVGRKRAVARRRRRKMRISPWLVLTAVALIIIGIASHQWAPALTGALGLVTLVLAWFAFQYRVSCDVKNATKPGFCNRSIRGALFGCGDHYWEKVWAWSRYLGTAQAARLVHVDLPILRWQVTSHPEPPHPVTLPPADTEASFQMSSAPSAKIKEFSPPPALQALTLYVTLAGGLATIIGLIISIALIPKG